jgi:predicted MPP superfamily phosphohydrolase
MFRKNCKCKTKICKCGKRKIRGGVGDEFYGIYNFQDKDVYCFSDIEGNMPTEIFELMNFSKGLETNNPLRYTKKNLEKKAIVFTGDLIDRGAYSIRNLWNMKQLKSDNPTNVILVCGNRDLNKIRMYHECCIPYIEENIFTSDNKSKTINEIFDLLDSKDFLEDCNIFKNISSEIAENINIPLLVNPHADYKEIKKNSGYTS